MIVGVLNQKGGTGKTTVAVHVGMAWVRQGARVLLIDADPQGSALDWSEARTAPPALPVIGLPKPTLHREVPGLAENYDHVIIDGPPHAEAIVRAAIMAADLVLIPVQPGGLDVWGARPVVALLAEAMPLKPDPGGVASAEVAALANEIREIANVEKAQTPHRSSSPGHAGR